MLRFNLTGYIFEIDGQQVTAVGGEYNTATLLNADKTEGYGLETDIQWTPTGHWLMTFGASWNPTEIKDPNLTVAPCGGGCTVTDPVIDGLAYRRRQQPAALAGRDLQRHHQLALGSGQKEVLRHPGLGLLLGQEFLSSTSRRSSTETLSSSVCAWDTPSATPSTKSPSSDATSSTRRSSAAPSTSTTSQASPTTRGSSASSSC